MSAKFRSCRRYFSRLSIFTCLLLAGITHTLTNKDQDNIANGSVFLGNATAMAQTADKQQCEDGLIISPWLPLHGISLMERIIRGSIYFAAMFYLFIGVSIVCDRFMAAIEVITSTEKEITIKQGNRTQTVPVRVWNETVANLTLMALGSSAPEILLSAIELVGRNFEAGDLGPGTIVGSAAFNLLVIIAICMTAVPDDEVRRIKHFRVFVVTASWSIFAYIWMYAILAWISPGVVEIWEGVLTLLFFPATVLHAYIADRRFLCYKCLRKKGAGKIKKGQYDMEKDDNLERELNDEVGEFQVIRGDYINLLKELRMKYPNTELRELKKLAQERFINRGAKSHNFYRIQAIRKMVGNDNISRKIQERAETDLLEVNAEVKGVNFQIDEEAANLYVYFEPSHYTVTESCGDFEIRVVRRGDISITTTVDYYTEDGTAEAGNDYIERTGTLKFPPGVEEQFFKIEVIDDDAFELDEHFYVHLTNPSEPAVISQADVATVIILDDDHAGIFTFSKDDNEVVETVGIYELKVIRYSGARGKVVIPYWTEDGTAIAGKDYDEAAGELFFDDNETEKMIKLYIIEEGNYEKDVIFYVNLGDPMISPDDELAEVVQTAESKAEEDLSEEERMALLGRPKLGQLLSVPVHIKESPEFKNTVDKLVRKANASLLIGTSSWKEQFMDALTVNTGDEEADAFEEEEWKTPNCCDYMMHFITLFWKILFAFIPPTDIYNGYLCFFVSVVIIGVITAVIGDVANHFGCTLGIKDTVTAITFIAIGTSVPDTFASRIAAIQDKTADNSIGNVTGSNAVNVFLGIGIAWTMGAVYHMLHGSSFEVEPGSMGFSLTIFLAAAMVAIVVLLLRRGPCVGGELGGPPKIKYLSSFLFYLLWLGFIALNILEAYGFIKGF